MKINLENIVYGIHPVEELIRAKKRKIYKIYVYENIPKNAASILKKIEKSIQIVKCKKLNLDQLSNGNEHQGIVAIAEAMKYRKKMFDPSRNKLILFLDKIQDTRNLGALLRSAYCTNIQGIVLIENGSASITPAALKSSAGLAEHLEISIFESSTKAIMAVKEAGYKIYLASFGGNKVQDINLNEPSCLVIGNEAVGITKSLYDYGEIVTLSQVENEISYNASVAGGIIMYNFAIKMKLI